MRTVLTDKPTLRELPEGVVSDFQIELIQRPELVLVIPIIAAIVLLLGSMLFSLADERKHAGAQWLSIVTGLLAMLAASACITFVLVEWLTIPVPVGPAG